MVSSGVSGMITPVSGGYIGADLVEKDKAHPIPGLEVPPIVTHDAPASSFFPCRRYRSLDVGSRLFMPAAIEVVSVTRHDLYNDGQNITMRLFVTLLQNFVVQYALSACSVLRLN